MHGIKNTYRDLRKTQVLALIFGIANVLSAMVCVVLLQEILDAFTARDFTQLNRYAIIFISAIVFNIIVNYVFQYCFRMLGFTGGFGLRKLFFSGVIRKPLPELYKTSSGEILTAVTEDTDKISTVYASGVVSLWVSIVQLVAALGIMLYYNAVIAAVVFAVVLLCFAVTKKVRDKIGEDTMRMQMLSGREKDSVSQTLNGAKTVKQLGKEAYFLEKYGEVLNEKKQCAGKLSFHYAIYVDIYTLIINMLPFLVIFLSLGFLLSGTMSLGAAVAFSSVVGSVNDPITTFSAYLSDRSVSRKLMEKDAAYLRETKEDVSCEEIAPLSELSFRSEGYPIGDNTLLEDVSFTVEKGDVALVTGPSGIGKSTLFNLVSRILSCEKVFVGYNGRPAEDYRLRDYYRHVLQVEQTVVTVHGTLLENLTFGEEYPEERIREAVQVAQLEKFVEERGLDFVLDEHAANVSGGERQRIGIARMLLRRPDLLLLDEPTSALDAETGENLMRGLAEYAKKNGMSLLVISHKSDADEYATRTVQLRAG